MGVIGTTPGLYCAKLKGDPSVLQKERKNRASQVSLDAMSRMLLNLGKGKSDPSPKVIEGMLAKVKDLTWFILVNERYDESLLLFAREFGLSAFDVIYMSQQVKS